MSLKYILLILQKPLGQLKFKGSMLILAYYSGVLKICVTQLIEHPTFEKKIGQNLQFTCSSIQFLKELSKPVYHRKPKVQ